MPMGRGKGEKCEKLAAATGNKAYRASVGVCVRVGRGMCWAEENEEVLFLDTKRSFSE